MATGGGSRTERSRTRSDDGSWIGIESAIRALDLRWPQEHLATDDRLVVDHETLRRWLLAEGAWQPRKTRARHRSWRERKACQGEMVQMDGSEHDWFEGRG
jgi:hypothetical protein